MSDHLPGRSLQIIRREEARIEERYRITSTVGGLWYLCTEVLGYTRLTEQFHKPMCDEMDEDRLGLSTDDRKLARDKNGRLLRVLDLWPRGTYKTTIEIGQVIQAHLADMQLRAVIIHAKLDQAEGVVQECGHHWMGNKKLREMVSGLGYAPATSKAKRGRWLKTDQFTFDGADTDGRFDRTPSFLALSTGADMTGKHFQLAMPDDIISDKVIEDSGLPKVKRWVQRSLTKALDRGFPMWAKGTRWDPKDFWNDCLESPDWKVRLRAIRETDGEPDYKGEVIYYNSECTQDELEKQVDLDERESSTDFAFQMMNDPSPKGEKAWDQSKCEHWIDLHELRKRRNFVYVVLGDPAPKKLGSPTGIKEKQRGDRKKDRWAWSVIRIQTNGQAKERVLMDGRSSREWTMSEGFDQGAQLAKKYGTNIFGVEEYGGISADYETECWKAAQRCGVNGFRYVALKGNQANRKNVTFGILASEAEAGRFFIYEKCPTDYSDLFLAQARNWRDLPGGRNTNAFDDEADITARSTNTELDEFSPMAQIWVDPLESDWDEEEGLTFSKFCGAY